MDKSEQEVDRRQEWGKLHPWYFPYNRAKERCKSGRPYALRGIKFLMTIRDFKMLWFRDKAAEMKQPSIDRIDTTGNYHTDNCRFIEMTANRSRPPTKKWLKHKNCRVCGRNDREYECIGCCKNCYEMQMRLCKKESKLKIKEWIDERFPRK